MSSKLTFLIALTLGSLSLAETVPESEAWQGKMKAMAETLGDLLPEVVSSQSDVKVLEKGAKQLSELSHDLSKGRQSGKLMPPEDRDPSVTLIVSQFSEQSRRAYSAIQHGQIGYAKNQLRTITSYCIACHTRHENGPEFSSFPLSEKANKLGKEEKGELYVATRQFDKALVEFQGLVSDEDLVRKKPFEWERPLRHSLAISVRVKNDPKAAAAAVDAALKSPYLPDFERNRLNRWKRAIEEWKKEPVVKKPTEKTYLAQMRRLITEAGSAQLYPIDRSAEIQYLRVTQAAHDVLRIGKDPKVKAEALLTAGTAYEILANPLTGQMHELYYEACVHQSPHTDLALDCFAKFEQAIYFGYTGSSGTHIPEDVKQQMQKLKSLASPVVKTGQESNQ